ncbi:hypothetical protein C1I98_20305 [Spongiactinospora gelatinilytica]|uniref:Uncharacterized protein n=1 Tax=Spongiactinospora gelatinilytica TaxID=2666298 RepID=A0A2W2G1P1_9ACTN|nr:hypothetical protein C1I98_20305 [Spongiactinospora gelatinilytica]
MLVDLSSSLSITWAEFDMAGQTRQVQQPIYGRGDSIHMPVTKDGVVQWAEIEGVNLWDCGIGIILGVAGLTVEEGAMALDPTLALSRTPQTPLGLYGGLAKSIADVGWTHLNHHAPASGFLDADQLGARLVVGLNDQRGQAVTPMSIDVVIRADPDAAFPPWPETGARFTADEFVRWLVPSWPDNVPTSPWRGA